jgi:hypothetical protein
LDLKERKEQDDAEYGLMRSFMISTPVQIYSDDQIEENELGGVCDMHGKEEKYT